MDGNGNLNLRSWGAHYGGLQLMPPMHAEKTHLGGGSGSRDQHPNHHHHHHHYHHNQLQPHHHQTHHAHPGFMAASTDAGLFHHQRLGGLPDSSVGMDYLRESWSHSKEKYFNMMSNTDRHHHSNYGALPESSSSHPMQLLEPKTEIVPSHPQLQESSEERDVGFELAKKRGGAKVQTEKSPKAKKAKRAPKAVKDESTPSVQRARAPKKSAEVVINGVSMDISGIPIPICTCTGTPQQCYRWGSGGWQSACCTTGLSMYPLPMNAKRRGARIAGRKMSIGAFKKVLEKLLAEDYDFSSAIDLRPYWAKHGTNKFVTIR